jgi:hypothetical protein
MIPSLKIIASTYPDKYSLGSFHLKFVVTETKGFDLAAFWEYHVDVVTCSRNNLVTQVSHPFASSFSRVARRFSKKR